MDSSKCKSCSQIRFLIDGEHCEECLIYYEELQRNDKHHYMQVTRDMAKDAGDLQLEGQWIKW